MPKSESNCRPSRDRPARANGRKLSAGIGVSGSNLAGRIESILSKTVWSADFADISHVGIAFGDLVTLRVGNQLFGFKLEGGQTLGWYHFLTCWYEHAKAQRAA